MKRLQIRSESLTLPSKVVEELNRRNESLVRLLDIEFAETEFYESTPFKVMELTQILSEVHESKLTFHENRTAGVLSATSEIPVSDFDQEKLWYGYEYAREQALLALALAAKKYGLDARALTIRAFHIRGSVQADRIRAEQLQEDVEDTIPFQSNIPDVIPVKRYTTGYSGFIGKYDHGAQFWGQVVAAFRSPVTDTVVGNVASDEWRWRKCWYAILHKFDRHGNHLGTDYKFTGTTADGESAVTNEAKLCMDNFIKALGPVEFGDIAIRLFKVEIDGHTFGMIDTSSHQWGDTVTMEPGDLVFYPPWDGEYDT